MTIWDTRKWRIALTTKLIISPIHSTVLDIGSTKDWNRYYFKHVQDKPYCHHTALPKQRQMKQDVNCTEKTTNASDKDAREVLLKFCAGTKAEMIEEWIGLFSHTVQIAEFRKSCSFSSTIAYIYLICCYNTRLFDKSFE